jgi:hypothetical protein
MALKKVLILGNGKSRLKYKDFVKKWDGEIWACNRAFLELASGDIPRINRLTGDSDALVIASEYRQKHGLKFEIYIRKPFQGEHVRGEKKLFTINPKYIKDSGTTWVCQALIEGYDQIYCVGFDLGGPDIYIAQHEKLNKKIWVERWRQIAQDFGLDKIIFVGLDHKPFILSNKPSDTYAKQYMNNNISQPRQFKQLDTVMILGNGASRLKQLQFINEWKGEIWAYNW